MQGGRATGGLLLHEKAQQKTAGDKRARGESARWPSRVNVALKAHTTPFTKKKQTYHGVQENRKAGEQRECLGRRVVQAARAVAVRIVHLLFAR